MIIFGTLKISPLGLGQSYISSDSCYIDQFQFLIYHSMCYTIEFVNIALLK